MAIDLASVDHVLTTTRSVRKRLDLGRPVPPAVIQECIEIAVQAPNGGNRGGYHFLIVTDAAKRARVAEAYARAFAAFLVPARERYGAGVFESASYLAEHLHEVPVHVIPCMDGRVEHEPAFRQATRYGSILPAAWSLMLALRARGLGSAWTTLHLMYEKEIAALLDIPADVTQAALLPVAYFIGDDFKPAPRVPARQCTYWDAWGQTRSR
jgi:nitroreductase